MFVSGSDEPCDPAKTMRIPTNASRPVLTHNGRPSPVRCPPSWRTTATSVRLTRKPMTGWRSGRCEGAGSGPSPRSLTGAACSSPAASYPTDPRRRIDSFVGRGRRREAVFTKSCIYKADRNEMDESMEGFRRAYRHGYPLLPRMSWRPIHAKA
jgi:hypothetical protein